MVPSTAWLKINIAPYRSFHGIHHIAPLWTHTHTHPINPNLYTLHVQTNSTKATSCSNPYTHIQPNQSSFKFKPIHTYSTQPKLLQSHTLYIQPNLTKATSNPYTHIQSNQTFQTHTLYIHSLQSNQSPLTLWQWTHCAVLWCIHSLATWPGTSVCLYFPTRASSSWSYWVWLSPKITPSSSP